MKKITVGFSRSKKKFPIGSWLIRLYQWTDFSHTYIKLDVGNKFPSDIIVHASEGLVQRMSETVFNKKHQTTEEFTITLPEIIITNNIRQTKSSLYNVLIDLMHEVSGENYSFMQNAGIVYVDFMRKFFNKRVKNPWPSGWNCSEFVMRVIKIIYYEEFKSLDPDTVTPKEIKQLLQRLDKDERYQIQKCK